MVPKMIHRSAEELAFKRELVCSNAKEDLAC